MTAEAHGWPLTGRGELLAATHAASLDPALGAVILTGPAGVGKTRLAQELLALHAGAGAVTMWLSSPPEPAGPLSSFAPLVPHPDGLASPFGQVRDALDQVGGGARVALALDDVQHLDPVSAGLLLPIVESDLASLIVTMPEAAEPPAGLATLWRSGRARAHAVPPLDTLDVDTLLHRVFGGCVDGRVVADFLEISRGNVLVLRELVRGSLDAGALAEVDGVWRLTGRPAGTTMLSAMVRRRIDVLSADARSAVEQVAVAGELDLTGLVDSPAEEAIEEAESAGLLQAFDSEDGTRVRVADALQREVLLEDMGRMRRARLARAAYRSIELQEPLPPGDLLRCAELRLDADGTAPPALLVEAARAAKAARNLPAVERLCRAALADTPDPETAVLLAEVLYENGDFAEADALLGDAAGMNSRGDDAATSGIAATRSAVLAFGLGRLGDGVDVLAAAGRQVDDTWARSYLGNRLVMHTLWSAGPEAAGAALADMDSDLDQNTMRSAHIAVAALQGATAPAIGMIVPDDRDIARLPDAASLLALTESGALVEATERAGQVYRRVAAERTPLAQVWIAHALGRAALARGRPATALRWFQEQFALAREVHQVLPLRLAVAGASVASVWLGDDAAAQRYDDLDDGAGLAEVGQIFPAEVAVGRAWRALARAELADAREHLLDGARHCLAIGSPGQAALAAHALVSLDHADDAALLLSECADRSDSALVAAYAEHARAALRSDHDDLESVAHRLADLGATLVAAEAAAQGAAAADATGNQRRAQALRNLANAWAGQCEGASTPALAGTAGVTLSPLTRRERQIAVLVAQGRASREVADTLFLSVRTVDNHLQRVFAKLGVSARSEVGDALRRTGQWAGAA